MDSFTTILSLPVTNHPTVAIKDSIDIEGLPTQLGSAACLENPLAEKDAKIVQLLKSNGFPIFGKTVMHELAYGMTGVNNIYGTPVNPLYPTLIPGGSSSGSATAVASGVVDLAIGTDTGGSVRLPAACCGIYGFKPTFGLISRDGVWPDTSSLDCVGVFATTPNLITQTMQAIAPEFDASICKATTLDSNKLALDALTLGWINVDADITIIDTIKKKLAHIPNITLSSIDLPNFENAFRAGLTIINRETWLACEDFYATGRLGEDVATRLKAASQTTDEAILAAETDREAFITEVDNALKTVRVLVLPTLPHAPMRLERALAGDTDVTISKLVRPFNVSGHPAMTLPCPSQLDYPIAIQLIGRKGDDAFICALTEYFANFLLPKK